MIADNLSRRAWLARVLRWTLIITVGLGVLVGGTGLFVEHLVQERLEEFVANSCASIHPEPEHDISVSVLKRSISITGLQVVPLAGCAEAGMAVHGTIDTLELAGISIGDLFFHDRLKAQHLRAHTTGLTIMLHNDTLSIDSTEAARSLGRTSIDLGSVELSMTASTLVIMAEDTVQLGGDHIILSAADLHFQNDVDSGARITSSADLRLLLTGLHARTSTGYACTLEHCDLDQDAGVLSLIGSHVQPVRCIEEHSAAMDLERDVFDARLDTFRMEGVDVKELLARGVLTARTMRFSHGDVTVLRDKTLPDEGWKHKPLLARVIRSFPPGMRVATIIISGIDVRYRERAARERGYSLIPFSHIDATITGMHHVISDTTALVLDARCSAFGDTPVSLHLVTVVQDTTDRMEVDAAIGRLPFRAINGATGPLVGVEATEGVMDSLVYHMVGDDRNASGTVRMTYSGLKLESGGKKRGQALNEVGTVLLNAVVRDQGRDREGALRVGHFTIDRRRDRAVFNYLWSGLREGSKAVMLPEVMTNNGRR